MIRKLIPHLVAGAALAFSVGAHAADKLVIAATPVPHAEILEHIKPALAKEGIDLQIKVFTDYVQPAAQTNEKQVDGNFFLHQPYLEQFKKSHKNDIEVPVTKVHVEPFAAYSQKYKKVADIPDGATIAIPNDPSNSGRALLLLARNGLIKLKDTSNISSTQKDITDNPKKLKFRARKPPPCRACSTRSTLPSSIPTTPWKRPPCRAC